LFRFLHAADLHLDSPFLGLERYEAAPIDAIRQASRQALKNLVDLAIVQRVAFVLIAGDVYDGDWQDVNTGLYFVNEMGRLREKGIRVYLISGNHDAANRMTQRLPYPDNVVSFPTDRPGTERLEDLRVAIHGQGYAEQKETRNLAVAYPGAMAGFLNIGLLHTGLDGRVGHDCYAPCQPQELLGRGYDYWALGHVHQRESIPSSQGLRTRVEFPGNVQGRHIEESGAKGCLLVHVESGRQLKLEFCPLDVFRWARVMVDCQTAQCRADALQGVADQFDELLGKAQGRRLGVRVELTGRCPVHDELLTQERQLRHDILASAVGRSEGKIWVEKVLVRTESPAEKPTDEPVDEDALSELTDVICQLRANSEQLQALISADEIKRLAQSLPAELTDGDEAIRLTDPAWANALLPRVQAVLQHAATRKEAVP
jgi:DNA repair protein SbcD/Mre11